MPTSREERKKIANAVADAVNRLLKGLEDLEEENRKYRYAMRENCKLRRKIVKLETENDLAASAMDKPTLRHWKDLIQQAEIDLANA
jgi:hypothetical protein